MSGALLGNAYSDKDIEAVINAKQLPAKHQTDNQLFEQVCADYKKIMWWVGSKDAWNLDQEPWVIAQSSGTPEVQKCSAK